MASVRGRSGQSRGTPKPLNSSWACSVSWWAWEASMSPFSETLYSRYACSRLLTVRQKLTTST